MPVKNVTIKNCYFYSCANGELKVYSGEVTYNDEKNYATFSRNIDREDRKDVLCSKNPGDIFRSGLWLKNRDDEQARTIFQNYANGKIVRSKCNLHMYESMLDSTNKPIQSMF